MPRKSRLEKERARKRVVDLREHPPRNVRRAKTDAPMLKELARAHTETAITELVRIMTRSKIEGNRLAAIEQLLNRGWGKPTQAVAGPDGEGPIPVVAEIRRTFIRPSDASGSNT